MIFDYTNSGENMNIDMRKYIIENFKDNTTEEIRTSIDASIKSKEEEPLIGLGVFFELLWNNSTEEEKNNILNNIKKSI